MKRRCLYALMALLALLLCACAQVQPPNGDGATPSANPEPVIAEPPPETDSTTVHLEMATGGIGGTYYPYGWALALAVEGSTGYIKTSVSSTGASLENLQQISKGEADLAIVQNDVLNYAYTGDEHWGGEPITNVSTMMSLYPEYCQLIAAVDAGINTVADLRGKHVSTGDLDSGGEANAMQILEAYGLTEDDLHIYNLGYTASAEAMQNRTIDAFFATSGLPNTAVIELSHNRDIRLISLDTKEIADLMEEYPFFTAVTIEESAYSFLKEPVQTVAVQATLIAKPSLDQQVAYDIVKAIIEDKEAIRVAHAKGAFISPEYAVQGVSADFHPGARRYFEEIGVL